MSKELICLKGQVPMALEFFGLTCILFVNIHRRAQIITCGIALEVPEVPCVNPVPSDACTDLL